VLPVVPVDYFPEFTGSHSAVFPEVFSKRRGATISTIISYITDEFVGVREHFHGNGNAVFELDGFKGLVAAPDN